MTKPPTRAPLEDGSAVEPEKITAAVTNAAPAPGSGPWDAIGMDKETWDGLEIPAFLRRTEGTAIVPSGPAGTASTTKPAPAPAADVSAGASSGATIEPPTPMVSGATGGFEHFRVDPNEIEQNIKTEADKRWRNWLPTKTDRKRPRLSTYERIVRKEFYP